MPIFELNSALFMPISQSDHLFDLVNSLTKAEKRNFKLYANRLNKEGDTKFITLFDILDKQKEYNEEAVMHKMPEMNKTQFSNLRRHLYSQILTSLRLIYISKNIDIQIREQVDFARILYEKGLYMQSLKLLERTKQWAIETHQDFLLIDILEFQKLIESRHITRSRKVKNKMENLIDESSKHNELSLNVSNLANLCLKIHGWYIQYGHIRNDKDRITVSEYFHSGLKEIKTDQLTFFEEVYLNQSYVWYHYILLDFISCYQYAANWVDCFEREPDMMDKDPDLYMRGLHYQLTSLFNLKCYVELKEAIGRFERFYAKYAEGFNRTSEIIFFLYYYSAKLNQHFIEGNFEEGIVLVDEVNKKLSDLEHHLDPHRIMVFYYKIAWMYFGAKKYSKSLDYLNKIIYLDLGHLREDIQSYARLLSLLVHYELKNFQLLEYQIQSVMRFMSKMEDLNTMQKEILNFLSRILFKDNLTVNNEMTRFRKKLEKQVHHQAETKSFVYLDVLAWLDSKIQKVDLSVIVRENFKKISAISIKTLEKAR